MQQCSISISSNQCQNKLNMNSIQTTYAHSQCTTPSLTRVETEQRAFPRIRHSHNPHNKMIQFMTETMQSISTPSRTTSVNKLSKASITVMPLTRQKIRVGQRGFKKKQSNQMLTIRSSKCSPSTKTQIQTTRSKQYVQFFTMLAFMYNKSKQNSHKLDFLIDEFIVFFDQKREKQYIRDIQEIIKEAQILKAGLFTDQQTLPYEIIKNCKGEISKLFFNICYELYLYKHNEFTFLQLDIIHRDIEYYSRRLGMLNLTVATCMDMGKHCLEFFQFEKASLNYSKALKLAVYNGDKYREEICIDKLGLCEYYRGDMVSAHYYHSSVSKLSSYNKIRIREHYSNQKQIQKILQQKTKEKSHDEEVKEQFFRLNKENSEFNFDSSGIDYEYTQKNYDHFRTNLKEMIKVNTLRRKVPMIKTNMQRAFRIGEKKIKGNNYIIPKASKFHLYSKQRSQDEFVLTHRSFNRSNIQYESKKIDKYCKILQQMINFFASDLKNRTRAIIQQRQSVISEDRQ